MADQLSKPITFPPDERRPLGTRALRWLFPFSASVVVHVVGAILIGTFVLGAYVLRQKNEPPVPVAVDFYAPGRGAAPPAPAANAKPSVTMASPEDLAPPPAAPGEEFANRLEGRLNERLDRSIGSESGLDRHLQQRIGDRVGSGVPSLSLGTPGSGSAMPSVAFVGLEAPAASVVYVVDASGSLVGTFPNVLRELERSLGKLDPVQRFSLVFFQRNGALALPPDGALRPATPDAVREAIAWARSTVRPAGRSNPVAALEQALALHPDLVFLLSTDITGSGDFEISREDLLARVDRLNPADSDGVRRTRIQCVQFLDPDPLDTLRTLAEQHGGGTGFRFVSREELGLKPRP